MTDFKILLCAYKATDCLKIQHEILKRLNLLDQLVLYENSPEDFGANREFLTANNVSFVDNPGGKHAQTINSALKVIDSKYVIILDEDCFLISDPRVVIEKMKINHIRLTGEISCSRGGYTMKPRINPWFCVVDNEWIKEKNIDFMNMEKIKKTDSSRLYLINSGECKKDEVLKYDVGATFFEDIIDNGGKISSLSDIFLKPDKLYKHIEGSSWRNEEDICNLMNLNFAQTTGFFKKFQKQNIETFKYLLGVS